MPCLKRRQKSSARNTDSRDSDALSGKNCRFDNPTVTELSRELRLSKPTVTVTVDRLVEKGFVDRVRSDRDRRSAHLHLTERGAELNATHYIAHIAIAKHIARKVTNGELEEFIRIVGKIVDQH